MRNELFTLDPETAAHAAEIRDTLNQAMGEGMGIAFTVESRKDHTVSDRVGTIVEFHGSRGMSNDSVVVDTDKGPRTFNVWLIRNVEIVGV